MGEFVLKAVVAGLVILLIWLCIMMFVDLLSTKMKKGLLEELFVAVVAWLIGCGAGSLFFYIFLNDFLF